jgi:leucyl-tRNA synthetase
MKNKREYDPSRIEKIWQKRWLASGIYEAHDTGAKAKKPSFYGLIEFPYPSGEGLHVGHIRSNTAMDIITRKRRMEGYNVLYPIGWDAFGLPTENYAIKTGKDPRIVTKKNTDNFRRQLQMLGFGFDWNREVDTTDPNYYRWTQWIFQQFVKRGLAYKKKMSINWCPKDKIGLANEEVIDGKCERCGTQVEKRDKEQWMLAITKYADRLDRDLDEVQFLDKIKLQQRNWIGKSQGAEIAFPIIANGKKSDDSIRVFTTRIDTLFGVTYVVLAPEHPLVARYASSISNKAEVDAYIAKARAVSDIDRTAEGKEKTGARLQGLEAFNPANGDKVPVFIADYVLGNYGTGAVMAVPAHDERDFAFAQKYGLPIKEVIEPLIIRQGGEDGVKEGVPFTERHAVVCIVKHWSEEKYMAVHWKRTGWKGFVIGGVEKGEKASEAGAREIAEETGYLHADYVRSLGGFIHAKFYQNVKKENRFAHFEPILYKLKDGEQKPISDEEKSLQEFTWMTAPELERFITHIDMKIAFSRLINPSAYTEYGLLAHSGRFDGMPSEEAMPFIAKEVGAEIKTQYKLRDWIFSRQRYWGEPIPMVHCDTCANRKQKVLLIHGFESRGDNKKYAWLKPELEKAGFEVFAPTMSTSEHPTVASWMKELTPFIKDFTEHDIIIGHSLGSKAALLLIQKTKKKIGNLFLIASAVGKRRDWKEAARQMQGSDVVSLKKFWDEPLRYDVVSAHVGAITCIASDNDPLIPSYLHDDLPRTWKRVLVPGAGHFDSREIEKFKTLLPLFLEAERDTSLVMVPEEKLPVKLPVVKNYVPTDNGESPLAHIDAWVKTKCPICGGKATRETDTMPNWAGSSWYYLRYTDPKNKKAFASSEHLKRWLPVNWYNGGMEHTTLHLLYSRFWHKFLYDIGYVPTSEPYAKRTSHGLILAGDGEKMSKSRGNVINPDALVTTFGADSVRLYEMFMAPFDQAVAWSTESIVGVRRFIERVWRLYDKVDRKKGNTAPELASALHKAIRKVTDDIEQMRFNTAVSSLMILINELDKAEHIPKALYEGMLLLLAPFAPFVTEELWAMLGNKQSIHIHAWPVFDASQIIESSVKIMIQVNSKNRAEMEIKGNESQEELAARAEALPEVKKWLTTPTKKVIYVKGRVLNIVI